MKNTNNTDWSLLAKYFAGETDEKENRAVSEWIEAKLVNRTLFNNVKTDWENINTMNTHFNVDKAWDKLHNRILSGEHTVEGVEEERPGTRFMHLHLTPLRIAASLILVIGLATAVYTAVKITDYRKFVTVRTATNAENTSITLPDGSHVTLSSGTYFKYPKNFGISERKVTLSGEAYFEVAHNRNWPFIIHANNAFVKVLGTSFNVNTNSVRNQVEVFVTTGKVQLYEAGNTGNSVYLEPGFTGTLQKSILKKLKNNNENAIAWKTKKADFKDTKLSVITNILEDVYKVKIVFKEAEIAQDSINLTFDNDPLNSVLSQMATIHHLKFEETGNIIYISKE